MNICIISNCPFLPELRYGRPYLYALALKQLGHKVTVLSPSFVTGLSETFMEFGKVIPFRVTSFSKIFGVEEPLRMVVRALRVQSDVYYVFGPVPTLAALFLKLMGKRVVYDLGDDNPSLFTETLIRKFPIIARFRSAFVGVLRAGEGNLLKLFDYTVTLTDTLRDLKKPYSKRVGTINYCADTSRQNVLPSVLDQFSKCYTLVYVGEISKDKGLDIMLESTNVLKRKGVPIRLLLIGTFCQPYTSELDKEFFDSYVKSNELEENVSVTGWIPFNEISKYISVGTIGLVLIRPWCYSYKISIPDKAIDLLSCGLPIVGTQETTELANIIRKSKAGIIIESADSNQLSSALFSLFNDPDKLKVMRQHAIAYCQKYHSFPILCTKLSSVLEKTRRPKQRV